MRKVLISFYDENLNITEGVKFILYETRQRQLHLILHGILTPCLLIEDLV